MTIGSRARAGRSPLDASTPIDLIDAATLARSGSAETGRMLLAALPSFQFPSSTVTDGTDSLRAASLRGLGPDQVLVLVNGKRRHTSGLIHVNGSVGRGTSGVDFNAIPASAIERIEVLRDGAAAQYGSDAIAGVINIILKGGDSQGELGWHQGEYLEEDDGRSDNLWFDKGWEFAGGFLNVDLNYRDRERTNRAGSDNTQWFPELGGGALDPREFSVDRRVFRIGDSESEHLSLTLNGAFDIADGYELYFSLLGSERESLSAGFYRRPIDQTRNIPLPLPHGEAWAPIGFLPLIQTRSEDLSLILGTRFEYMGWDVDIGFTHGANEFNFEVRNSVNASWVNSQKTVPEALAAPRSADAGTLGVELQTLNADFTREADFGNLAFGAFWRRDRYQIEAGEEYSWQDYDVKCLETSTCLGLNAGGGGSAGIQVFPGYQERSELDKAREAHGVYADVEHEIGERLRLGAAARFENYSDFGDTLNGKLSARWRFHSDWALRASISSGFKAPSIQQLYFNNISTQFSGDTLLEIGTFHNGDPRLRDIGVPELSEEKALNLSLGLTYAPASNLSLGIDVYSIDIEDRILLSGQIDGAEGTPLRDVLSQANVEKVQFFFNAADTATDGLDLTLDWAPRTQLAGELSFRLAANISHTRIEKLRVPSKLAESGIESDMLFSRYYRSILEDWTPRRRVNADMRYRLGGWDANLSLNHFGKYQITDSDDNKQTLGARTYVNLNFARELRRGLEIKFGVDNLFGTIPEKSRVNISRSNIAGLTDSVSGETLEGSYGPFELGRHSASGFNGAFYHASLRYGF